MAFPQHFSDAKGKAGAYRAAMAQASRYGSDGSSVGGFSRYLDQSGSPEIPTAASNLELPEATDNDALTDIGSGMLSGLRSAGFDGAFANFSAGYGLGQQGAETSRQNAIAPIQAEQSLDRSHLQAGAGPSGFAQAAGLISNGLGIADSLKRKGYFS